MLDLHESEFNLDQTSRLRRLELADPNGGRDQKGSPAFQDYLMAPVEDAGLPFQAYQDAWPSQGLPLVEMDSIHLEVVAGNQPLACAVRGGRNLQAPNIGSFLETGQARLEMQRPGFALIIHPTPVIEPKGGVTGLLHFQDHEPSA